MITLNIEQIKRLHTLIFAAIMAAVMFTAVLSACRISSDNKETDNGGLGGIVAGGSSTPDATSTPDPMRADIQDLTSRLLQSIASDTLFVK